jgi:hypothetical protein
MLVIGVDFTVVPSGHVGNSSMYSWTVLEGPLLPPDKPGSAMSLMNGFPCLKGFGLRIVCEDAAPLPCTPEAQANATGRLISLL